jgi:hypothetical protein
MWQAIPTHAGVRNALNGSTLYVRDMQPGNNGSTGLMFYPYRLEQDSTYNLKRTPRYRLSISSAINKIYIVVCIRPPPQGVWQRVPWYAYNFYHDYKTIILKDILKYNKSCSPTPFIGYREGGPVP